MLVGDLLMQKFDLIVIGAGPAGLTCGIYATRANLKTLIIDNQAPGGQVNLTEKIDNYPGLLNVGGFELGEKMHEHAVALGVEEVFDNIVEMNLLGDVKTIKTEYSGEFCARAVVVATGASPRKLNAKNEEKFIGHGVGYCATCDGAFSKGKDVAVVGGGNAAVEEALYLARIARHVDVFHILNQFQCNKVLESQLLNTKNITVHYCTQVKELLGDKKLSGCLVEENGHEKTYDVEGLFVSIGRVPNSGMFEGFERDKQGYFVVGENLETSVPGVFVAGDVRQKVLRQIVTACADGAIAASEVAKYLL